MPNWVKNIVVAKDVKALKKHLVNDKGEVDFNMIIPMSKDLQITSGGYSYDVKSKFDFGFFDETKRLKKQEKVNDLLATIYTDDITQQRFTDTCILNKEIRQAICKYKEWKTRGEHAMTKEMLREALEQYIKGYFNMQRYGFRDWYDWSIENWDTKWNACDDLVSDNEISFNTAWSMPEKVYKELAKYTPIKVLYADEDMGVNCGLVEYSVDEDGNIVVNELMGESRELAYYVWGYDFIPVYDDNFEELPYDDERVQKSNQFYGSISDKIERLMSSKDFNTEDLTV